jgi:peptidoglycan hydrolase CwlO-like protein
VDIEQEVYKMPIPPGTDIFGGIIWLLIILLIGVGVLIAIKMFMQNSFQQPDNWNKKQNEAFNETLSKLLKEIKDLKEEIRELRRELKE